MFVRLKFRQLRKMAAPRPEFRHALWTRLTREMETMPNVLQSRRMTGRILRVLRYAAVPVVVLVLAMGTGAYAYVNPEITYEHPLYQVKHAVEQVEGAFVLTPRARARFETKMMARRVLELETIVSRGKSDGRASDEIARAHEQAISAAAEVKSEAVRDAVIARIEENADRHVKVLEAIEARAPEEAEKTLEQVIERQEQVLERRLEHVDALREEQVARQLERIEKLEALRDQAFAAKEAREEAIENEEIEAGEGDPPPLSSPFPKGGGSEGGGSVTRESPGLSPDSPSRPLPDSVPAAHE